MKYFFMTFAVFSSFYLTGQTSADIQGSVINQDGEGIDLAIIGLYSSKDSVLVQSEYTDQNGKFKLSKIPYGKYYLDIRHINYLPLSIDKFVQGALTWPAFKMFLATNTLETVTVKGRTPYIERKIDRTVINPNSSTSNAASNALEALENSPGVLLDNNGDILLKGRSGVAIFINDKPSNLSGTELQSYLQSLPVGSIQKIELMTNPPANYEAAGNGGVINLVIKRNALKGLHGNVSLGYRQGKRTRSNNSLNLSYNKNKFGLYANLAGGLFGSVSDLTINRFYLNNNDIRESSFKQSSLIDRCGQYLNSKIGMDYYLTSKTTFGLSAAINTQPSENQTDNVAFLRNQKDALIQRVLADNHQQTTFDSRVYNAYLTHNIDSNGQKVTFDLDYATYKSDRDQVFLNNVYNSASVETYADQIDGATPSDINIWAFKSDYSKTVNKNINFEAGIKTAYSQTDNEAIYINTIDSMSNIDLNLSNRFLYNERISAGYINFRKSFSKLDIQLGLRAEHTILDGDQRGNEIVLRETFNRSYTSLFPTGYLSYKLDSAQTHILTLDYGRRIDRPYFQDLNPFISPLDRFTFYAGNPDLQPTYSNNISLTYSMNGRWNTTLSYSKTLDGINETLEIRDEIYYSRPGNIANNDTWTLSTDASISITDWYSINTYAQLSHFLFNGPLYTETLNSSGYFGMINVNNTFRLGKGWKGDLSGLWRSDLVYSQLLIRGYHTINAGLQKTLFDGKASIKLSINDILYTAIGAGVINNLRQTEADWVNIRDTRIVSLNFNYRFGKSTSNKKRHNSSGSASEQRRVRS